MMDVYLVGVGMTKFGRLQEHSVKDIAAGAVGAALFDAGIGAEIESGSADFTSLEAYMLEKGEIDANQSGRQEMLEHLVNRYF